METLKTELIDYFDQLDADVNFSYVEVQKDTRKGTIQALRISLKRLQAFIKMWSAADPHFPAKAAIRRFKILFMEVDRLRDMQVEHSLVNAKEDNSHVNQKTFQQIAQLIREQQRVFREFEEAFSIARPRETCIQVRSHLTNISLCHLRVGIRKYFQDLLHDLTRLARESMRSKKCLRELRQRVREAQYNLIAIDAATPHVGLPMDLLQPLETLQHKLGKWQKHCIAVDESKNLWNVPQSLRRQLRHDEAQYLKEIRGFLAQLPELCHLLWNEMDQMLAPQKEKEEITNQLN